MEIFYILFSNTGFNYTKTIKFYTTQGLVKFGLLSLVQITSMQLKNFDSIKIIFLPCISQTSSCPEIWMGEYFTLGKYIIEMFL